MRHAHPVLRLSAAWLVAAVMLPAPGRAAPRPNITLEVTADDGSRLPAIDVTDLAINFARSSPSSKADADHSGKEDDAQDNASIMLDTSVLSNAALLGWIRDASGNASVSLKVTGGGQETTYVLSGLTTWSLSVNHSLGSGDGQLALTLGAKHMTINGAAVN